MKNVLKNKNYYPFSPNDIKYIKRLGFNVRNVKKQIDMYKKGLLFLKLNRPCRINDGIVFVTSAQRKRLIDLYEKQSKKHILMKFVPASGAASRMFGKWFSALQDGETDLPGFSEAFLKKLKQYPFYFLVRQDPKSLHFIQQKDVRKLLNFMLSNQGLNFGGLPKALIPFHLYGEGNMRTALEEHILDAVQYAVGANHTCYLHFTVSEEHKGDIKKKIKALKKDCGKGYPAKYKISISCQSPSTNMLAVDENNLPVRDRTGCLIFRPGGHGALLTNLNKVDADYIFIRNIDNVAPQSVWQKIVPYRKMMGGLIMQIQEEIFDGIHRLKVVHPRLSDIKKIHAFCFRKLNVHFPANFDTRLPKDKIQYLFSVLNRPLRVCGMVKNNDEPGGGPFWVEKDDGFLTMQIVEYAHVDKSKNDQQNIWSDAQYFNPVDMVCSIKDYQGKKFNLSKFVDHDSYVISMKKEKGRNIRALEVPGLWNGGMSYWNTVFVELPLMVFNPVKVVDDLLRPEHLVAHQFNDRQVK